LLPSLKCFQARKQAESQLPQLSQLATVDVLTQLAKKMKKNPMFMQMAQQQVIQEMSAQQVCKDCTKQSRCCDVFIILVAWEAASLFALLNQVKSCTNRSSLPPLCDKSVFFSQVYAQGFGNSRSRVSKSDSQILSPQPYGCGLTNLRPSRSEGGES
jgi:hypothetical protein